MRKFLAKVNVSKKICDHLLNDNHTDSHRMGVGVIVVFVGVTISKIHVELMVVHYILDGIGYAIHGIGLVPFIDRLIHYAKAKDDDKKDDEE